MGKTTDDIGDRTDPAAADASATASVISLLKALLRDSGVLRNESGEALQFTDAGELWVTETERENNVRASYALTGIQASAWAVLVDLSDDVNWPHDGTARIHISLINAQIDKAANSVGLMQLGVVTRVDATNGDVTMIASMRFENDNTLGDHMARDVNVAPSQIKCDVVDGATPKMISNVRVLNDTGLQTDTAIPSARGVNVAPAVGDIVIRFVHTSGGAWTGAVGVLYHAHAT